MKVLSVLINLVPYHVARWNAASCLPGVKIDVIQMRSQDEFAVLEASGALTQFRLHTLGFREDVVPVATLVPAIENMFDMSQPDIAVIGGYSFPISLTTLMVACNRKIPVVICSESNRDDFPRRRLAEAIKSRVVRLCSAGLAGATPQKYYLCELGLPSERVFTGYNAVDNDHFARGADQARLRAVELRTLHRLPDRFIVAVARFAPKKNLAGLISAYGQCLEQAGDAVPDLVILGDGPLRAQLEQQIAKSAIGTKVHLLGPVSYDSLPTYYGLAMALVHASTTEQWGLVVNEAMAAGLPVLVSNRCGCARDLVCNGVNGFTFDPHDHAAISRVLGQLMATPAGELAHMSAASRDIITRWGPFQFAAGLHAALAAALATGPKRLGCLDTLFLKALMRRTT